MTRAQLSLVLIGSLLIAACSGSVFETAGNEDAGGGAGGATTGGSGGSPTGGSGGGVSGGSGGGVSGGSGGGVSGGSGGGVSGGFGGGEPVCPPQPICDNWCNGQLLFDVNDCLVGFLCANGVDPCNTAPCDGPEGCMPGEVCKDSLCWPGDPLQCSPKECKNFSDPDGNSGCQCHWTCTDSVHKTSYTTICAVQQGGELRCQCDDGSGEMVCGSPGGPNGGPPDPCSVDCCGFPQPQ